jgi:hypothetical protein
MATAFKTLAFGNGFPFCLSTQVLTLSGDTFQNVPTLEETMNAYWNIDSVSFGGATFDPTNEPKDLICNPDDNIGSDTNFVSNTINGAEYYAVAIQRPRYVTIGSETQLQHGISFVYENLFSSGGLYQNTTVVYQSSWYRDTASAYQCDPIYYKPSKGAPLVQIGNSASQGNQSVSSVTIGGIPFVKSVKQYWDQGDYGYPVPPCPSVNFLPVPSATPTLTLHTY